MKIGIPKEVKIFENRVGLIPDYVKELTTKNHIVYVQKSAGVSSGFSDETYLKSGAVLLDTINEIYEQSDLIVKVKEPQNKEFPLIKEHQGIFGFFHFPADKDLLTKLIETKCTAIAFETLLDDNGNTPILAPMSAIAGKLGVFCSLRYLNSTEGGKGTLLGGIPGTPKGHVVIIGGGQVGQNSCIVARGIGAYVTILEVNTNHIYSLKSMFPDVEVLYSNKENIERSIKTADIVISGVHLIGKNPPILISKDMLRLMKKNSILVDISVDQGGIFETSRPTTLKDPIFREQDIIHFCVANIPSMASKTASEALSHVLFPYLKLMVENGLDLSFKKYNTLQSGLNLYKGVITNKGVAETFNFKYHTLNEVLS